MARTDFEKLQVYRLAEQLSDEIWEMVLRWDHFSRTTLGQQMVCSCDSVGANIAEGVGRGSYQDNRRFVRVARGSLNETRHWLRRAYRRRLITPEEVERLKDIIDVLSPKLNNYLKSIGPRVRAEG